jgi:PEGA domain
MKFTQSVLGITCVLALAVGASPASAQSRERAPQRHGSSYRQSQPQRQVAPRGPDRVNRTAVRTSRGPDGFRGGPRYTRDYVRGGSYVRSYSPSRYYGSRGYGYAVPRHYDQRRRGGVYRSGGRYYRPYYRPYYRTYYRPYYRYYPSRFYFGYGYGWGYPYSFVGYPYYAGFGYPWGWGYGNPYGGYAYPYYRNGYAEDQGGIRLQMNPKDAQVTVDGYFVGEVDDFDGISQRLALEAGPHKIEITAPGYEPFTLEVNILREQTIKYKGVLRPLP